MKLGYVILYVPNVAAAVRFYEAAFGLTKRFIHESGQYAEMETDTATLAFAAEAMAETLVGRFRHTRLNELPPSIELGLVTDDVHGAFRRALAGGCEKMREPAVKPWGQTVSYVRDDNGYLIEICSPIKQEE